jgi:outer membrane protein assembly factor BamA
VVPPGQTFETMKLPDSLVRPGARRGLGERIVEIKVVDNTKTDAVTVEYLANVKVGETLTPEVIERVKTNLLSIGLFKDVIVYWEEIGAGDVGGGVRLVISAKDKLSWIVAPIFAYSSANVGGGVAFAESNLAGKNKKLLFIGQYATAEKLLFLAYLDPNIRNTRWYYRLDALVRRDTIREYSPRFIGDARVSRATDVDTFGFAALLGINLTRRWHFDVRLKFYYDVVNPSECFDTTNFDGSGTPDVVAAQGGRCLAPSGSGWDNTLTFNVGYDGRSKVYGVLKGFQIFANYQYGASWLGTPFDYHLLTLQGMYAFKFWKEHNLLLKFGGDLFFDPPFKMEVETGGQQMRGFLYRQFRGDTSLRFTVEYLLPLFTIKGFSLRLIAFYDTNLTFFRSLPNQDPQNPLSRVVHRGGGFRAYLPDTPSGVVRDSWVNGIGGGVRMYLKGVVLPLVGVDIAHGFEAGGFQVYLALGSNLD